MGPSIHPPAVILGPLLGNKENKILGKNMTYFDSVQGPVPFASLVSQLFLIIWLAIAAEITVGL